MNTPQKPDARIPVIIAGLDGISGVSAWSFRLRESLRDHPRYRLVLVNCRETGNKVGDFDHTAPSRATMRALLRDSAPAIVVPNFIWPVFDLCAELIAEGASIRCLGFCRADSDPEYYNPLAWYEPLVSRFVAVSPECAEGLAKRIEHRRDDIATLPTGVHVPQQLDRNYQTEPLRLVYGGRIVQQQKRVLDFVPLVHGLLARGCDFTFDIVGQGRQLRELKGAMAEVDHGGRVHFLGKVSPAGMDTIWRNRDVFIQCSDFEGTSNSMLESMAWGTIPVVTQTESGLAGIVEHGVNGFVVPVGDMEAMVEVLCSLTGAAARLGTLGRAAHDTAKAFSIAAYAERFVALLDETLSEPLRVWPASRNAEIRPVIEGLDLPEDAPETPSLVDRMAARVLGASAPDAPLPADFTTPDTLVLVTAADDNFVMPLAALVKSVLCNLAPERRIVLYVIDGGIDATDKARLLESWGTTRCVVRWLRPEWSALTAMKITGHVNILTYARLLIPTLLPGCHAKAIYLDSDIIVLGDLAELWDIETGERHLLAVQDMTAPFMCSETALPNFSACAPYLSAAQALTNFRELGIPPHAKYFNAGVLVFNLAKWRDTNAAEAIIEYLRAHPNAIRWWDQDGLNAILHNQWGELDLRWNQIPHIFRYPSWRKSPFGEAEFNAITRAPRVVHFSARSKPWHGDNTHPFRMEFFRYLDQTSWSGWRPQEPLQLTVNGDFALWEGDAPAAWTLSPGTRVERSPDSRVRGTSVRILAGGESGLAQQLSTPPELSGTRLAVSVDGRCDERDALVLVLTVTSSSRSKTYRAIHPGHGAWATLRHEIDLIDAVPTAIHCQILLREKTSALVESFCGLAFPREREMEWEVPRAVDLRRPRREPLWRRWIARSVIRRTRPKARQRNPVFSVILSNFNGAEFLEEALRSVAEQECDAFEFIIVDDASTDDSRRIIHSVASRHPQRIHTLYKEKNEGQAAGFNDGFRIAQGDILCFIDSDDRWFPDKLARLARLIEANPGCAIYQHNLYKLVDGRVTEEKFRDVVQTGDLLAYTRRTRHFPYFVPTSGLAFSRSALESVMPIPNAFRVCADGFLTRTTLCFGPIASTNECWGAYRVHDGNNVFENPEHDSFAYTNGLLIPTLNAFYQANDIDLSFEVKAGKKAPGLAPRVRATNRSLLTKILDSSIRELLREAQRRLKPGD